MTPRVLIAGLIHESNGFVAGTTPLSAFTVRRGAELLEARGDGSTLDGLLAGGERLGWRITSALDLRAMASATAEDAVLAEFIAGVREVVEAAREPFDGVALVLHGAMLTVGAADAEGAAVASLRSLPRLAAIPIVATFDLHGNPSPAMCAGLDAVAVFRRNPHDDLVETGARAAATLDRLMRGRRRGRCVAAHSGVVWTPLATGTADAPMDALEAAARAAEAADPELLEVAVFAGFAYADHPDVGVSICVSTLGGEAGARAVAERIAALAHRRRRDGDRHDETPAAALRAIRAAPPGPVIVAEPSDNIGAGTHGDGTGLLRLLLEHDLGGTCLAAICDPRAVATLAGHQPGGRHRLAIGGRGYAGDPGPLEREWEFRARSAGGFRLEDPASPLAGLYGSSIAMGPCVVLAAGQVRVLVTSVPMPPWDLAMWRSVGLAPEAARVIAVKSAIAHRRAYTGIAAAMLSVETPGPCPTSLVGIPYRRLRRPVYPLDG